ncbi:MAG: ABC transporter ATP-binding protein [Pyrinomonadaceae bacterium]
MLVARDLTVNYDHRVALAHCSIGLAPGEITAVIGPNGAGKSTLLKALNGRFQPAGGEVLLDNVPVTSLSRRAVARRIAVVAQEGDLRFPVSVLEFVLGGRFPWTTHAAWETERDLEVANSVLIETELTDFVDRSMNEISGGERQRALLARALTTEAPVLLLDEPTANLDLAHQAALITLVRRRCDENRTAALIVTHDINLAAEFADRVLLMKGGKTVDSGEPEKVLRPELLAQVFDVKVLVDTHPISGAPRITPVHARHRQP